MLQELAEKSKEIEAKNRKIQEIEPQYVSLKNYAVKLEAHYKTKKDEFAEEMRQANTRFEFDVRMLREKLHRYKEKANTLQFSHSTLGIPLLQSTVKKERIQAVDDSNVKFNSASAHIMKNQGDYHNMPALKSNINASTLEKHRVIFFAILFQCYNEF